MFSLLQGKSAVDIRKQLNILVGDIFQLKGTVKSKNGNRKVKVTQCLNCGNEYRDMERIHKLIHASGNRFIGKFKGNGYQVCSQPNPELARKIELYFLQDDDLARRIADFQNGNQKVRCRKRSRVVERVAVAASDSEGTTTDEDDAPVSAKQPKLEESEDPQQVMCMECTSYSDDDDDSLLILCLESAKSWSETPPAPPTPRPCLDDNNHLHIDPSMWDDFTGIVNAPTWLDGYHQMEVVSSPPIFQQHQNLCQYQYQTAIPIAYV